MNHPTIRIAYCDGARALNLNVPAEGWADMTQCEAFTRDLDDWARRRFMNKPLLTNGLQEQFERELAMHLRHLVATEELVHAYDGWRYEPRPAGIDGIQWPWTEGKS